MTHLEIWIIEWLTEKIEDAKRQAQRWMTAINYVEEAAENYHYWYGKQVAYETCLKEVQNKEETR